MDSNIDHSHLLIVGLLISLVAASATTWVKFPSQAQSSNEREFVNKVPKRIPLKIEIKKDKEALVKALNNEKWVRDLELEITNISNKPIYYFDLMIVMPDVLSESGHPMGFPIQFGRSEFIHFGTRPIESDKPISPDTTYTFKIPDKFIQGWEERRAAGTLGSPRKLEVVLGGLSFGDGTGFVGVTGTPYPFTEKE